jgi:tellurite resistance protein TerC
MLGALGLAASEGTSRANFVKLDVSAFAWGAAIAVIIALLAFDILILNRKAHIPTFRRALLETCCWLSVGLAFGLVIVGAYGGKAAGEYYAGYLIELSLSVDNVFVWALILSYFAVPRQYQHRLLFWGIFGAVLLRAIFVFAGVALVNRFEWILIIFGVFLLYSAYQLLRHDEEEEFDPEANKLFKLIRRVIPSSPDYDGQRLFTKVNGKRLATPMFAIMVLVDVADVLFAVDSVPAVLGVAREQFIVLTSNAFAILGLRAMYFLFADLRDRFTYIQQGLAVILAFVGVKMILDVTEVIAIPTAVSLLFIVVVLGIAIALSILRPPAAEGHG